jgi:hypothetical protein
MLLSADALTSGMQFTVNRKHAEKPGACGRARRHSVLRGIQNFPTEIFLQSVTLLNLEFFFLAVIFKVADSTRNSFSL